MYHMLLIPLFLSIGCCLAEDVHMTEVFIIKIEPGMFNWTFQGESNQFSYQPSLLDSPDLPAWIHYMYSRRHHTGFLYGVPPWEHSNLQLEIVGLNRINYETRRLVINMNVAEKPDAARFEVQLKIDNLNVEDMFDERRLERLLDVFRHKLWQGSQHDLYVTFLASAVQLGARLPLRPTEGEGVVLRLGSRVEFSPPLVELQEEVKPLWKLGSCPRDFKRTTVDRLFRDKGFNLDWCTFRLVQDGSSSLHQHSAPPQQATGLLQPGSDRWLRPSKAAVPQRSYVSEFVLTILVPMLVMLLMVLLLSVILCFHHEGMDEASSEYFDSLFDVITPLASSKRNQETPALQMVQYSAVHRATNTLRSLSSQRRSAQSSESRGSPSSTLPHTSTPRLSMERGSFYRPNPPPYMGPPRSRADF